jgi:hypothetical protein
MVLGRAGAVLLHGQPIKSAIRQLFAFQRNHFRRTLLLLWPSLGSATYQSLGATIPLVRMPQSAAQRPSVALNAVDRRGAGLMPIAVSGAAIRCVKAALKRMPAPSSTVGVQPRSSAFRRSGANLFHACLGCFFRAKPRRRPTLEDSTAPVRAAGPSHPQRTACAGGRSLCQDRGECHVPCSLS